MSHLEISLLGPFRVTLDGKSITRFEADTARALLAYLALNAQAACRRETLAGLLWPEQPEAEARHNLRQALSRLRKAIGDRNADPSFLLVTRQTIQLNPDADAWLDVAAFDDLIATCQGHHHRRLEACRSCIQRLGEAVDLYRGDLLSGFSLNSAPFEEWLVAERERRHRRALDALHCLAAYHERRGEYEQVRDYAQRQLALEPWREEAHRQLMRALALSGRRAAALAQYETCHQVLAEELGVEPEGETRALYERIREDKLDDLSRAPPHNLPVPLTPFVGREAEMAEIEERLGDPDCRLLTLVGPGGIGKTSLALEAASAQVDAFGHGVFFVPLAPLQSADAIVPTVARTLNFSFYEGGEPRQQLLDYLRQKSMLLVLDNYEHLLSPPRFAVPPNGGETGGADLVTDILRTAPEVNILATSRERLNVRGEHLFPVGGMDYPSLTPHPSPARGRSRSIPPKVGGALPDGAQHSAVRLFLHGARRVRPDFEPTEGDLAQVIRTCQLVHGMPLGILLAASLMEMLTPAEIAVEIEQSLDVLATDLRDLPERQRSMRAVLDHSWRLLTGREQEIFAGLSVFRGGFTRHAARQVARATLPDLMALTHKSLLRRTGGGRYDLWHELLRQYADEKLRSSGEADAVRDAHSAYYAAALQQWGEDLKGPRQQVALTEMDVELENARVAWDWAAEQKQVAQLDQAVEGLCRFYSWRRLYQKGETACRAAVEGLGATTFGDGLRVLAKILAWQGRFSAAEPPSQLLQQSLTLLESPELADQDTLTEKAFILHQMGSLAFDSNRERAGQLHSQSLALYQAAGDRWGTANVLNSLGWVARSLGAHDEARKLWEENLAIYRTLGDPRGISHSVMQLGLTALYQGQLEEGERLVREGTGMRQEMDDRFGIAGGLSVVGLALHLLGKLGKAQSLLEESTAIFSDLGSQRGSLFSSISLGDVQLHLGRYEQARSRGQMVLGIAREIGPPRAIGLALGLLGRVALAGEAYADAQGLLKESFVTLDEISQRDERDLALVNLAVSARGLGQLAQARQHLWQSLKYPKVAAFVSLMFALPAIALLLADQDEVERAVELYALALRYPFVSSSRWFEDIAGRDIAAAAASLPPDVVAAAQERGWARDLEETVKELLVELEEQGADAL